MNRFVRASFYSLFAATALVAFVSWVGCQATAIDGLSEAQANQVLVTLNGGAISAQKVAHSRPGGEAVYRVEVDSDELAPALALLRAAEVPTRTTSGWAEVFGSSGLLPTTTEERARYGAALSGELERSIEAMDGVIDARVHLALPETCTALLDGPRPKGRASVMIKQRQGAQPVDEAVIRALVAGATTELETGEVTVVRLTGSALPAAKPDWVRVGPLTVSRSSAPILKAITAALFLLDMVLAIALVALLARFRRASARNALARGGASPDRNSQNGSL